MSASNSLHYALCLEGAKWLRSPAGTRPFGTRNKYVTVEMVTLAAELVDVWGTNGFESTIIEVKTSLHDFYRDSKKFCRSKEAEERGLTVGNYRYYLCPADLIQPEQLPEKWGLLYWTGKNVVRKVLPGKFEVSNFSDLLHLTSIMRREGIKNQVFNYRKSNKKAESN